MPVGGDPSRGGGTPHLSRRISRNPEGIQRGCHLADLAASGHARQIEIAIVARQTLHRGNDGVERAGQPEADHASQAAHGEQGHPRRPQRLQADGSPGFGQLGGGDIPDHRNPLPPRDQLRFQGYVEFSNRFDLVGQIDFDHGKLQKVGAILRHQSHQPFGGALIEAGGWHGRNERGVALFECVAIRRSSAHQKVFFMPAQHQLPGQQSGFIEIIQHCLGRMNGFAQLALQAERLVGTRVLGKRYNFVERGGVVPHRRAE